MTGVKSIVAAVAASAVAAVARFETELRCVAEKCGHVVTLAEPPTVHPAGCPKCGAPVRLSTRELPAPLLTIEEAASELRVFVVGLAERITPEARDFFARLGAEIEHMPGDIRAHIERMRPTKPADSPSNVGEVIQNLADKGPPAADSRDPELPPGSA